jgi:hypothetical protein
VTVELEKQKQIERGTEASGNVFKANRKKSLQVSEEKRGDMGNV